MPEVTPVSNDKIITHIDGPSSLPHVKLSTLSNSCFANKKPVLAWRYSRLQRETLSMTRGALNTAPSSRYQLNNLRCGPRRRRASLSSATATSFISSSSAVTDSERDCEFLNSARGACGSSDRPTGRSLLAGDAGASLSSPSVTQCLSSTHEPTRVYSTDRGHRRCRRSEQAADSRGTGPCRRADSRAERGRRRTNCPAAAAARRRRLDSPVSAIPTVLSLTVGSSPDY